MKNKSLYELLGMKAKNSIFKSVFVTEKRTFEGYKIVEVEAYDDTFLNAISTMAKYDKCTDRIFVKVYKYFKKNFPGEDAWIILYTEYGQSEHLLSDFFMKEVYKLIK